jgi:16S rRNA (adenine1518-N6/adenine1519-N6)-dimethyltransferase
MTSSIRAKKSLGQNFLINQGVLERIVVAAQMRRGDTVLEIGPGTGALTEHLASTGAHVIAVEKDHRLIESLREKFTSFPNVTIIEDDILRFDPASYDLQSISYKLIANIPYYLSGRLFRLMFGRWPAPTLAVLMVQHEVAKRILAAPPNMNLLALSTQLYAEPSLVMRVSRGSFRPMPDVDSAVISLKTIPNTDKTRNEKVIALAKKAFAHKRKQIGSSFPKETLQRTNIDPTRRPQELSIEDWLRLTTELQ